MVRRSVLFSPGDRPEMMRKAPRTGADVIVFDLEDAVAPERKGEARAAVGEVLMDPAFDPDCEVCVRVNPAGITADDDLNALAGVIETDRLDSVMLPKPDSPEDVLILDRLMREHGVSLPVLALIETASGVLNAGDIAAVDATDALVFGAEDLSAGIGATRTTEGTEMLYAREHVVIAAKAAEIDAIDTVHPDIEDLDGLADETAFAVELGYDGKVAIHPDQVDPINDAFTPTRAQIEWAERVLEAHENAKQEGRGVFRVDGEMIDAPLIVRAEQIMARARAADEV